MSEAEIIKGILILIGDKCTQDIIDNVMMQVFSNQIEANGGFATVVARAAGMNPHLKPRELVAA